MGALYKNREFKDRVGIGYVLEFDALFLEMLLFKQKLSLDIRVRCALTAHNQGADLSSAMFMFHPNGDCCTDLFDSRHYVGALQLNDHIDQAGLGNDIIRDFLTLLEETIRAADAPLSAIPIGVNQHDLLAPRIQERYRLPVFRRSLDLGFIVRLEALPGVIRHIGRPATARIRSRCGSKCYRECLRR